MVVSDRRSIRQGAGVAIDILSEEAVRKQQNKKPKP